MLAGALQHAGFLLWLLARWVPVGVHADVARRHALGHLSLWCTHVVLMPRFRLLSKTVVAVHVRSTRSCSQYKVWHMHILVCHLLLVFKAVRHHAYRSRTQR
jgi:hypothetical protein